MTREQDNIVDGLFARAREHLKDPRFRGSLHESTPLEVVCDLTRQTGEVANAARRGHYRWAARRAVTKLIATAVAFYLAHHPTVEEGP